jgi:hypothetical protein
MSMLNDTQHGYIYSLILVGHKQDWNLKWTILNMQKYFSKKIIFLFYTNKKSLLFCQRARAAVGVAGRWLFHWVYI